MDILLVGFVAGLTFGGWRTGFLHRLVGLALLGVSFLLGAWLQGPFGDIVSGFLPDMPTDYASLLGYVFVFPVLLAVLHLVTYPLVRGKRLGGMTAEVDRVLGALLGFVEGVLILSVIVVILDTYFSGGTASGSTPGRELIEGLTAAFNSSYTVQLLRSSSVPLVLTVLGPLLPADISSLIPGGTPSLPGMPGMPGIPGIPGRGLR